MSQSVVPWRRAPKWSGSRLRKVIRVRRDGIALEDSGYELADLTLSEAQCEQAAVSITGVSGAGRAFAVSFSIRTPATARV